MYCNKCGAQIADGIAFCPKCGAKQNIQAGQEAGVQSGAAVPVRENPGENLSAGQKYLPASYSVSRREVWRRWPPWPGWWSG